VTALDGGIGALLADERKFVKRLARNALERRDGVSTDALVCLRVTARRRMLPASMSVGPAFGSAVAAACDVNDIISVPPAITRSSMPDRMAEAAMLTAVIPDPQNLSSVMPDALTE